MVPMSMEPTKMRENSPNALLCHGDGGRGAGGRGQARLMRKRPPAPRPPAARVCTLAAVHTLAAAAGARTRERGWGAAGAHTTVACVTSQRPVALHFLGLNMSRVR